MLLDKLLLFDDMGRRVMETSFFCCAEALLAMANNPTAAATPAQRRLTCFFMVFSSKWLLLTGAFMAKDRPSG
jgi:hypothetical protein